MKKSCIFLCLSLIIYLAFPSPALADTTESYDQSITTAITNSGHDAPYSPVSSAWLAADNSIIVIPDTGGTFGLKYDSSGNLIVRTANNSNNFKSNYVGQPDYKIYGPATTSATFVTTGNDFTKFYDNSGGGATNTNLIKIVERGLGINTYGTHNAMVEFSVDPHNNTLMRPTQNPDIKNYATVKTGYGDANAGYAFVKPDDMSQTVYDNFKAFYAQWVTKAYTQPTTTDSFPFTQLGYTYFWGSTYSTYPPTAISSKNQGATELILLGQTQVNIYAIYATSSYIYTKNKNGAFSSDSDAEYGNGFASFNITGDCDTVWAGHSFQNNVSRDASNPNQIIIASAANMTGGEGILVWSLNYKVNNSGTIYGATSSKFKIADTDNIAVMFEGDTSTLYGSPILAGKNTLINSGTIASTGDASHPGIAVYTVNGDTDITNTGTIAAYDSRTDSYGIWLKGSTNTISNSGTIGTISGSISGTSGTGVRLDSGNTTITNNTGCTIYGNTYGIRSAGGTNTIINYGTISSAGTAVQIDAGTTTVTNSGGTVGDVTVANDSTAALNVGNNALAITGTYTQNAAGTLKVTANSSTDYGSLTATTISNSSSNLKMAVGGYIPDKAALGNVVNGTGVSVPGAITSTSPIFSFAGNVSSNKLSLTATRANSYQSFAANSNAAAAGAALNSIAMAGDPQGDMKTALGNLDSLTSGGQINQALNTLTPNVDNSVTQVSQSTQDQYISAVLAHLDGFKNIMNSVPKGVDVWTSGFGSYIHQDEMASSNGYNATIWGTALGFDIPSAGDFRAGLSGGYAQDYVRTKDNSSRTDIDSYQGTLYASYAKNSYFIDTAASFAYNCYDGQRQIAVGSLARTAAGNYNGQQYSGYIQGGYKFTGKGIDLTPLASFLYSHLRLNSYAESGADALDLKVSGQDYDIAQTGLGIKAGYPLYLKNVACTVTPEFKFKWLYDWVGDAQQATSTFTGGGGSFATQGFTPPQSSYDFGARLTIEASNNITVSLNYDLEIKENFYGHYGYGEVRYRF